MILVDTSAWIDYFKGIDLPWTRAIRGLSLGDKIVLGDLVIVEILQGIRDERRRVLTREAIYQHRTVALCNPAIAEQAADNYRFLRRKGITIRGTIDVIIATWCIANRAAIIHNDRDMAVMERELGLVSFRA